jgi:hypothetical protein
MQTVIQLNTARLASLLVLSASLAACGGGGSDSATQTASATQSSAASQATSPTAPASSVTPPTAPAPVDTNRAPTISGSAVTSITAGQAYNFVPTASDADSDRLQFSISSKPGWAAFDAATGRLSGVPTSADVGSYEEVEISVTDGKVSTTLPQFTITVAAATPTAQSLTLSWQPPTTNADGTALTNLNGYRILYGLQPGAYTQSVTVNSAGLTRYTIDSLQSGTYYLAMVAVNSVGAESDKSREVAVNLL